MNNEEDRNKDAVTGEHSPATQKMDHLESEPGGDMPGVAPITDVLESPTIDTGRAATAEEPSSPVVACPKSVLVTSGVSRADPEPSADPETSPPVFVPGKTVPHKARFLPNCKVTGIDYSVSLSDMLADEFLPNEIRATAIYPRNIPFKLDWCPEKGMISCHPNQAGEFEVDLCVDILRHERHVFPLKLTVNPDPKTLWKNIPSDQHGIYAKPDSDSLFLPCGNSLSIVAASQRGRSHAQEGKPRDDDFTANWDAETECAILIVADGAGSAKFARKGSQIVTQVTLEKVKAALTPDFWIALEPFLEKWSVSHEEQLKTSIQSTLYKVLVTAAWEAKQQIKQEAQKHEARYLADYKKTEKFSSRDYATTLILTVARKRPAGSWLVATFWVGDGGQGIYCPDADRILVQGIPDGGEFGGQTRFLTEESTEVWPQEAKKLIQRRLYFDIVDSFTAVILMTDGVSDPKFETESNLTSIAKWDELWADLNDTVPFEQRKASVADALLKWMDFWSPGNHDDRTMLILY